MNLNEQYFIEGFIYGLNKQAKWVDPVFKHQKVMTPEEQKRVEAGNTKPAPTTTPIGKTPEAVIEMKEQPPGMTNIGTQAPGIKTLEQQRQEAEANLRTGAGGVKPIGTQAPATTQAQPQGFVPPTPVPPAPIAATNTTAQVTSPTNSVTALPDNPFAAAQARQALDRQAQNSAPLGTNTMSTVIPPAPTSGSAQ